MQAILWPLNLHTFIISHRMRQLSYSKNLWAYLVIDDQLAKVLSVNLSALPRFPSV